MAANPWEVVGEEPIGGQANDQWAVVGETPAAPNRTMGQEFGRQLGLTARVVPETLAAIPLTAMDTGIYLRNKITGSNYDSASSMFNQGMDAIFPKRENTLEKAVGIVGNAVVGSRLPVPVPQGGTAPAGFQTAKELSKLATAARVKAAQEAGYVIPPATSNPTGVTKAAEGLAGKLSTAQAASARNMSTTNRLASRALGLSEDAPLTIDAVRAVRSKAGDAYEAVRTAGAIPLGPRWDAALNAAEAASKGANRSFPGLAKNDPLAERIAALRKTSVDSGDAIDAIKILREYADEAGASGAKHVAGTYRKLATALENQIDDYLSSNGPSNLVQKFREARQLIAKTYTVEKAMNKATGEVSAAKLGQQLGRGAPLSGELKQAGEFALAFPKAARPFNESLPGISPLDFYAAGGTAALTGAMSGGSPAALLPLAYPFIRQGTRNALLSPWGQSLAVPAISSGANPQYVMGATNAFLDPANR